MDIYKRIKCLRKEQGITQQRLAEMCGYKTASAINKIELGLRDIKQGKVIEFAKALNTTPAYLLYGENSVENSNVESHRDTDDANLNHNGHLAFEKATREADITRLLSLTDDEWQKVDAFVQGLIANR